MIIRAEVSDAPKMGASRRSPDRLLAFVDGGSGKLQRGEHVGALQIRVVDEHLIRRLIGGELFR